MTTKTYPARYLDNGFYIVSNQAAGALVRAIGHKLPRHGWEKFVFLQLADGTRLNAWLQRTRVREKTRWAVHGMRRNGEGAHSLGSEFNFTPAQGA